ncbi:hypothetical protein [Pseudoroseomonas cervicalis]|uniref:hypothetical protein n=1 Tax=Teichococcus cervicalis TaxID=204525 RepID=UPI0022F1CE9F|nr:hypothetical protein [Pseudoroseomonas cervicalis]WBV42525.1 hypothetical protein PFY06_14945 [Pseudoroseomonas cervicalis]
MAIAEGQRFGRFVIVRDADGTWQALSVTAVMAACETDTGTVLLLPGGRMLQMPRPLFEVLSWLNPG